MGQRPGRNLFAYSATAKLTINFVFDERQHATRVRERLLSRLQQTEASHADLVQSYGTWRGLYQDKRRPMKRRVWPMRRACKRIIRRSSSGMHEAGLQSRYSKHSPNAQIEASQRQLAADQSELRDIIATLKGLEDRDKTLIETHTRQAIV